MQVKRILRNIELETDKTLNILTFPTHERYETGLCHTGNNFFGYQITNAKKWYTHYAPVPSNYILLPENTLPKGIDFDLVLCQNKEVQLIPSEDLANLLNVPLVILEHCLPTDNMIENGYVDYLHDYTKKYTNVFISEYSRKMWGFQDTGKVVHHMVDTKLFRPRKNSRKNHILSVVNGWKERDILCGYKLWQRVIHNFPYKVVGDNPGLSTPAKNPQELAKYYREAKIFLNTSLISPIPTVVLEAMASGCAVVSTATCMIPDIIEDGVNGFCTNSESALRDRLALLLNDDELALRLGRAARRTILSNFNLTNFVQKWNKIFLDSVGEYNVY